MRNKKICALWLCIVALCIAAIGAVGLWRVPNLLQYAIPAPTETQPSSDSGEEGKAEEAKSALSVFEDVAFLSWLADYLAERNH